MHVLEASWTPPFLENKWVRRSRRRSSQSKSWCGNTEKSISSVAGMLQNNAEKGSSTHSSSNSIQCRKVLVCSFSECISCKYDATHNNCALFTFSIEIEWGAKDQNGNICVVFGTSTVSITETTKYAIKVREYAFRHWPGNSSIGNTVFMNQYIALTSWILLQGVEAIFSEHFLFTFVFVLSKRFALVIRSCLNVFNVNGL